jgi:AbrB family looped-hinge helix DNA binding protein
MEFSVTKLSKNGQIVIPSEIRNAAKLKPFTKLLVMMRDDEIVLKQLQLENLEQKPTKTPVKTKKTTKKKTETTTSVYA